MLPSKEACWAQGTYLGSFIARYDTCALAEEEAFQAHWLWQDRMENGQQRTKQPKLRKLYIEYTMIRGRMNVLLFRFKRCL